MKDYALFENWQNSHATEMQDLTFAKPDDFFIYTRFTAPLPCAIEGKEILFAEDIKEVAGYMRHIYLYDILNDMTDDMELDPELVDDEKQQDAISILNYWFKLGKILEEENIDDKFYDIYNDFNNEFNRRGGCEYEFRIIKGADNLRDFLIEKYKGHPYFNEEKLRNICSSELFAGRMLQDLIDTLLY